MLSVQSRTDSTVHEDLHCIQGSVATYLRYSGKTATLVVNLVLFMAKKISGGLTKLSPNV